MGAMPRDHGLIASGDFSDFLFDDMPGVGGGWSKGILHQSGSLPKNRSIYCGY